MKAFVSTFLLLFLVVGCATNGKAAAGPCSQCQPDQYCAASKCDFQNGSCKPKPQMCNKMYSPVCGCDGKDYPNECVAAAAGISIKYAGRCALSTCASDADCGTGLYCQKASCDTPRGGCEPKSEICPELYAPVCGCDNKTYSSKCHAAGAGMNVRSQGECAEQNTDEKFVSIFE